MVDKSIKDEIKMENKYVLSLFGLIEKYCDSVNCDYCIIKDICECTYDKIGIPNDWIKTIKERIVKNETQNK